MDKSTDCSSHGTGAKRGKCCNVAGTVPSKVPVGLNRLSDIMHGDNLQLHVREKYSDLQT